MSPVHECAESGDLVGLVRLLVSNPSLLSLKTNLVLETLLHVSAGHNKVDVLKYLLDWSGIGHLELETMNAYGETPLHLAAKNGCNEAAGLLLDRGADIEARTSSWMTPLHVAVGYAMRTGDNSIVKTLTELNADCSALDEDGKTPFSYLPEESENEELRKLLIHYEEGPSNHDSRIKRKMDEFSFELSKIVGLHELKMQLQRWAKGMLMDKKRRSMGIDLGPRKPPHMAFLGNPGTGKTTVARILGKLLCSVGVLDNDKVTEVQRSDLVAEYVGQTGPKTKKKIKEAKGGILFVDEAYRLTPDQESGRVDFGVEALEEIMSVMEDGKLVIIFAGYTEPMKRVFSSNEGFTRRVSHFFQFDNFTCKDLAKMLLLKMTKQGKESRLFGFKLHSSCTIDAVAAIIEKNSNESLRNKMNGGLVDHMLNNARENLDSRLPFDSNRDDLLTIALIDLEAGLKRISKHTNGQ